MPKRESSRLPGNLPGPADLTPDDRRWLRAAAAQSWRAQGLSRPNPGVVALIVRDGVPIARACTAPGGRPHAEALSLAAAGDAADGATLYVTLEPCAHDSTRGPACADLVAASGIARIVIGLGDPDPRTAGKGIARLLQAGKNVAMAKGADQWPCAAALGGYLMQKRHGRPLVTVKLASSLDGAIALANGESRWITGPRARAHAHVARAMSDAILVGGGTFRADAPQLNVRLPGLEDRQPDRIMLSAGTNAPGWTSLSSPQDITGLHDVQHLLIEGGAGAAAAFLHAGLVDRLMLYRAPILLGGGRPILGDLGLDSLEPAHDAWRLTDARTLGSDRFEAYDRRDLADILGVD